MRFRGIPPGHLSAGERLLELPAVSRIGRPDIRRPAAKAQLGWTQLQGDRGPLPCQTRNRALAEDFSHLPAGRVTHQGAGRRFSPLGGMPLEARGIVVLSGPI
jgi:hypothetical protein